MVRHVGVFFLKKVVLRDSMFDVIFRIVGVLQAIVKSGRISTEGWQSGVTVALGVVVGRWRWVVVGSGLVWCGCVIGTRSRVIGSWAVGRGRCGVIGYRGKGVCHDRSGQTDL